MKKLLFIFLLFLPLKLMATEYHVAKSGNNGNTGVDSTQAWLTISYGLTQIHAGDILSIHTGTYVEVINSLVDGTALNPIIIRGAPKNTVIIDGEYTLPGGTGNYWYLFFVKIDGDYTTLRDVTVRRSTGGLIRVGGTGSKLIKVQGEDCYETGIVGISPNVLIDSCHMSGNGNHYGIGGQTTWGSAICVSLITATNCTISNCVSHDNRGEGYNSYSKATGTIIRDNIAYDNWSQQIYLDGSPFTSAEVYRNIVFATKRNTTSNGYASGIVLGKEIVHSAPLSPTTGIKIHDNLIIGTFCNFLVDSNVDTLLNDSVYNNTFINCIGNAGYQYGVYYPSSITTFINSFFVNNIVIEDSISSHLPIWVANTHPGLTFSHNAWNETVRSGAQGTGDVISTHLCDRSTNRGAGILTYQYFRLQSASVAINAGATTRWTTDYNLASRAGGNDIGALEYYDPTPPVLPTVVSSTPSRVHSTFFIAGGDVTSTGGATVTAKGLCYSHVADPTTSDSTIVMGTGTGAFSTPIPQNIRTSHLWSDTTYHVRAYATNSVGTAYGADQTVTTAELTLMGSNGTFGTDGHGAVYARWSNTPGNTPPPAFVKSANLLREYNTVKQSGIYIAWVDSLHGDTARFMKFPVYKMAQTNAAYASNLQHNYLNNGTTAFTVIMLAKSKDVTTENRVTLAGSGSGNQTITGYLRSTTPVLSLISPTKTPVHAPTNDVWQVIGAEVANADSLWYGIYNGQIASTYKVARIVGTTKYTESAVLNMNGKTYWGGTYMYNRKLRSTEIDSIYHNYVIPSSGLIYQLNPTGGQDTLNYWNFSSVGDTKTTWLNNGTNAGIPTMMNDSTDNSILMGKPLLWGYSRDQGILRSYMAGGTKGTAGLNDVEYTAASGYNNRFPCMVDFNPHDSSLTAAAFKIWNKADREVWKAGIATVYGGKYYKANANGDYTLWHNEFELTQDFVDTYVQDAYKNRIFFDYRTSSGVVTAIKRLYVYSVSKY